MAIQWNRVTWYSQAIAVILAFVIFGLGYWLGERKGMEAGMAMAPQAAAPTQEGEPVTGDATYACDGGATIHAIYHATSVQLLLSDGRNLVVPQAISGSGARYANDDESFVFWNKGTTAFVTEGTGAESTTTFAGCSQMPAVQ
jgi:membrane-bound inhibitor of C-type lysozyme